jgi:hypothetical protein
MVVYLGTIHPHNLSLSVYIKTIYVLTVDLRQFILRQFFPDNLSPTIHSRQVILGRFVPIQFISGSLSWFHIFRGSSSPTVHLRQFVLDLRQMIAKQFFPDSFLRQFIPDRLSWDSLSGDSLSPADYFGSIYSAVAHLRQSIFGDLSQTIDLETIFT